MKPLAVIGDSHGFFTTICHGRRYSRGRTNLYKILPTLPCNTVQLGDYGIFNGEDIKTLRKIKPREGFWDRFFRGNHDNPSLCRKQANCLGDFGILPDYPQIMFFAGAESTDVQPDGLWPGRTKGKNWWTDEQLSPEQMDEALELYSQTKPEIVLSHDCPTRCWGLLSFGAGFPYWKFAGSRTPDFLDRLLDIHKPRLWFFGHHHQARGFWVDGVKFRCCDELEVVPVEL